jgi:hypothetical protein
MLGKPLMLPHRYSVWRILVTIADPIGRVPPYGAWLGGCAPARRTPRKGALQSVSHD